VGRFATATGPNEGTVEGAPPDIRESVGERNVSLLHLGRAGARWAIEPPPFSPNRAESGPDCPFRGKQLSGCRRRGAQSLPPPFQNAGTSRALAARHHANRRMPPPSSCVLEEVKKEKRRGSEISTGSISGGEGSISGGGGSASERDFDGLHQREPAIYSGVCAKVRTSSSIVPKIVVFAPQRRSRRSMALNRMRLPS